MGLGYTSAFNTAKRQEIFITVSVVLADQIEDITADPNYSCESTDALAGTIAKMLADVALRSPETLRDFFNKLKVRKPDKKNDNDTCKPTEKADLKDCYKNIPNIGKLKLGNDDLKRFEDALGANSFICSNKKAIE